MLVGAGAVLIRGAPGSGKSSLAAALIAGRGPGRLVRLVADDGVLLDARGDRLVAVAPEPTRGLIERRGVGIAAVDHEPRAVVRLLVDLSPPAAVERLPDRDAATVRLAGIDVPRIVLPHNDPAAAERVLAALSASAGAAARGENGPGPADAAECIRA